MKKILAISGSSQKNGTGITAFNLFKENFDKNKYEFETIHLTDYNLNFCKGCTACFKSNSHSCIINDDLNKIIEKIDNADGLVFITPIYAMNISGALKTFLDRTTYLLHQPQFYKKHAFIILSTDMGGVKLVRSYLKYILNAYCINSTGAEGVLSYLLKNNKSYQDKVQKKLKKASINFKSQVERGENYQPSFAQIIRFNVWRTKNILSKDSYSGDYNYWKKKNWLESDYFYPIKLNSIKRFIIRLITKRIKSFMIAKLK